MKLYGLTRKQLDTALEKANRYYQGNILLKRCEEHGKRKPFLLFTLRVWDSHGPGAGLGFSGRRTVAACWHAHRAVMDAIFTINREAVLKTAWATYRGRDEFLRLAPGTGERNVGSMVQPRRAKDAAVVGKENKP